MIDDKFIFDSIDRIARKLGNLVENMDKTDTAQVVRGSFSINVITITSNGALVPVEIRENKDKLGWLYESKETYVMVKNLGTCKLADMAKLVEDGVKNAGKKFSDKPQEFMLNRVGESIYTYVNIETLRKILC